MASVFHQARPEYTKGASRSPGPLTSTNWQVDIENEQSHESDCVITSDAPFNPQAPALVSLTILFHSANGHSWKRKRMNR